MDCEKVQEILRNWIDTGMPYEHSEDASWTEQEFEDACYHFVDGCQNPRCISLINYFSQH